MFRATTPVKLGARGWEELLELRLHKHKADSAELNKALDVRGIVSA